VEELAKSVRHEQRPAIYNESRGNFYFYNYGQNQQIYSAATSPALTPEKKEDKFWEDAKLIGNKEAVEAYLAQYPAGRYAALAKAYLTRLLTTPNATPVASDLAISLSPSVVHSSSSPVDCTRLNETKANNHSRVKDLNKDPADVIVISSNWRQKNTNNQTSINCNREK
jgi:hypothetical protein